MIDILSKMPIYCQLAETIEEKINDGTYPKGEKIPSERELCEIYNVSRTTVRLAAEELERKGKIQRIQGKGTFVLNKRIIQNLGNVYSFSKEMEKQGNISSTKIIRREIIECDHKIARHLSIKEGDSVVYLERLRLAEDVAIMVEKSWFPCPQFEFLLNIDFTNKGLYKTLESEYSVRIDRAVESFKATELNPVECKLLSCKKNQYGLLVKRTSYSGSRIVCYSTIVSKGDIFEFTIELKNY